MTCQHINRTVIAGGDTADGQGQWRRWRCDDCGEEWVQRQIIPDTLYHCDGNCIDCPNDRRCE